MQSRTRRVRKARCTAHCSIAGLCLHSGCYWRVSRIAPRFPSRRAETLLDHHILWATLSLTPPSTAHAPPATAQPMPLAACREAPGARGRPSRRRQPRPPPLPRWAPFGVLAGRHPLAPGRVPAGIQALYSGGEGVQAVGRACPATAEASSQLTAPIPRPCFVTLTSPPFPVSSFRSAQAYTQALASAGCAGAASTASSQAIQV